MVAIGPQIQRQSDFMAGQHGLPFPVLTDPGNAVAEKFGLVYTIPEYHRDYYLSILVNIPFVNGDKSWRLPLPATYVIARRTARSSSPKPTPTSASAPSPKKPSPPPATFTIGEAILLVIFRLRFCQNENRCWSDRAFPPTRCLDGAPSFVPMAQEARRSFGSVWPKNRPNYAQDDRPILKRTLKARHASHAQNARVPLFRNAHFAPAWLASIGLAES